MEGINAITQGYAQGGAILIIVICFVCLLVYTVRQNEKREDRLYKIIDVLSDRLEVLPKMQEELKEIRDSIKQIGK